jgi:hypothetical protein
MGTCWSASICISCPSITLASPFKMGFANSPSSPSPMALIGSADVGPLPLTFRLPIPWGPDRGGLAQRSLPWAMRRFAYSGLFLMPSMALMAFAMFVKLTNAQFLARFVSFQYGETQPRTYFSFKKLTSSISPYSPKSLLSLSSVKVSKSSIFPI